MKKFFKVFFISLFVALLLLQFYPKPVRNISQGTGKNDITLAHHVPDSAAKILKTSCYDCHSNNTSYPWYANIQPVAWWLGDHVKEGKSELNFSEFGTYNIARKYRKLEEIGDQVKEGEMPLSSYTIIHRDAKLSADQKNLLSAWVVSLRDSFKIAYPPDSLIRKKKIAS